MLAPWKCLEMYGFGWPPPTPEVPCPRKLWINSKRIQWTSRSQNRSKCSQNWESHGRTMPKTRSRMTWSLKDSRRHRKIIWNNHASQYNRSTQFSQARLETPSMINQQDMQTYEHITWYCGDHILVMPWSYININIWTILVKACHFPCPC